MNSLSVYNSFTVAAFTQCYAWRGYVILRIVRIQLQKREKKHTHTNENLFSCEKKRSLMSSVLSWHLCAPRLASREN
jgi:hypothetical protein